MGIRKSIFALISFAVAAIACNNPLSSKDVAGLYTWNGKSDVIRSDWLTYRYLADTLILRDDQTAFYRIDYEEHVPNNPVIARTYSWEGTFSTVDQILEFVPDSIDVSTGNAGIGFTVLNNGMRPVERPDRVLQLQ